MKILHFPSQQENTISWYVTRAEGMAGLQICKQILWPACKKWNSEYVMGG
jgi:hypothetical protein